MGYKVFTAGEEALASDVNSLLMSQTVARFATAAARSSALTAPVLNQLSMRDDRPGTIERWNGSGWVDIGQCLKRQGTQSFGGVVGATPQDITIATFTMPFLGTIFVEGVARIDPGGGSTAVPYVALIEPSPVSVPVAATSQQFGQFAAAANTYIGSVPFRWKHSNVPAATACTLKMRIYSNNVAMGFNLTHVTCDFTIVPQEF